MAGRSIVLKNVCKEYGKGVYGAQDINLEILSGEFLILVGPSGCGKSTTLRMIAGLEEISSGELWIDDMLANFLEPRKRNLSMVFQNYALYPNMNVYKNIAFSLEIRGVPKAEIDGKVREAAALLGLEQVLERRPLALSGGQRQRVAIANAIIRNPDILLMDEPLSNLDAKLRSQMRVELAKLHRLLGNTIVYVTHDQTEAMSLGSRIVVMKDGRIQQEDTPQRVYENPVNQFVAGFIGSPPINLFEVELLRDGEACALAFGEHRILCGRALSQKICRATQKTALTAGIRPEGFLDVHAKGERERELLDALGEDTLTGERSLMVTVHHREHLGSETLLYFDLEGKAFCMRASAENDSRVGDRIPVWVDLSRLYLFDRDDGRNIFL